MSEWQPIATAPKDGTWILLRGESGYVERPYRAHVGRWRYNENAERGYWDQSEDAYFTDDGDDPTHWMPLL